MALVSTDWSITAGGDIRYDGPAHGVADASYATTIELHRWLQDLADDASASGDDLLDITDSTPSERNGTDNNITIYAPYNIDQTAAEHLYDGSIAQAGGDDIWDGFVNYGNEGINIQILQDGAYEVNDFWNSTPDGESLSGLNRNIAAGISHRFMLKVRTTGDDIDGRRVIGMSRELGKTYSEFKSTTSRGNNTLALVNAIDLNNQTAVGVIEGWTIANIEGYRTMDVDIDTVDEHYYSEYDRGIQSINDLYEYVKMETAYDRVGTVYGIDGKIFRGITHEIQVGSPTGTFDPFEEITWGTGATAGMGQMLAINSTTAATALWMQLITGVVPTDTETITGTSSSATVDMDTNITERTVSPVVIGASTGSAIIGAYGFGVEALDLSSSDKVFALEDAGTPVIPPDYQTTKVAGLIDGNRVLVGPNGGGTTLQDDQLAVSTAITSGATTIIMKSTAQETIGTGTQFGTDCPAGGGSVTALRVLDDGGVFWRIPYSAVTHGSGIATFTVSGGDTTGLTAAVDQDGFIGYIDATESGTNFEIEFTTVFHSARSLFVRVRDAVEVIKTFEGSVALGGSISAIRGADD